MVQISEAEFVRNEQERLEVFAQLITRSGISLYEISKGSRVKYDTLLRALRRQCIRPENEARIRFYINTKNNEDNENQTDRP
jgi:lambda repressor-like predicted transcriptional regulator